MLDSRTPLFEQAFSAIEAIHRARTPEHAMSQVCRALEGFGFTAFVLTRLPRQDGAVAPDILLNGWPAGWTERYAEAGHYRHDPLSRHCLTSSDVFSWDEIPKPYLQDRKASHIIGEAAEFRLVQGLCVPTRTSLGIGGFSLAGQAIDQQPGVRGVVRLLAMHAWDAVERTSATGASRPILSVRERDVLRWIAQGKTVQDVATILAISDHTVAEHLKKVRSKLDTSNNAHSVVRALQLGQIAL